jgi:hypothetical protein
MPYNPGPLPKAENRPDNTIAWIAANAAVFAVAAPFAVAYWASKGKQAIRKEIRATQPNSAPFRDFRRLQYEAEREAKLGVPVNNEVYLPMRLDGDRQRPSESLQRPSAPIFGDTRVASPSSFARTAAPRGSNEVVLARFMETRVDLRVAFADREEAKGFGARWDADAKKWYAPPGTDLKPLKPWLPTNVSIEVGSEPSVEPALTVPAEITRARQASQTSMRLEEGVLVGAMAESDGDLPPIDAYDDINP